MWQEYKNTVKSVKRERIMESGMLLYAKNGYLSGNPCFFKMWREIGHGCLFGDENEIRILKKKMHSILMSCIPGNNGVRRRLYSDLIIGS